MKRNPAKPRIAQKFWRQEGKLWFAEREGLEAYIKASGRTPEDIRNRIGAAYKNFQEVQNGKPTDGWGAAHIEYACSPVPTEPLPRGHSWPPPDYKLPWDKR